MAAPSVPSSGEPLFISSDSKGSLSSQGSMPGKLDGRALLDLLPAQAVVFIDRAAARAAVRAVERSGVEGSSRLAEAVGYLAKLPGTSTAVVLADVLAAKFWCPDGSNPQRIDAWLRTFNLKAGVSAAAPDFYRHLYQLVSDPMAATATQRAWASRLRSDASLLQALSNRQPSGSIKAFNSIISRQEVWSAIERIDPLLRDIAVLTGEVVKVGPNRLLGGIIEASASTPFKLRPGRVAISTTKTSAQPSCSNSATGTVWSPASLPNTRTTPARAAPPPTICNKASGYSRPPTITARRCGPPPSHIWAGPATASPGRGPGGATARAATAA